MRTHLLALAVVGLAIPVFAATPLGLHKGSTREWVRYSGTRPDSVRVRLEFIDSTYKDSSFSGITSSFTDWRVRIVIPDTPSIRDTAVLRVINTSSDGSGSNPQFQNFAYWRKPSLHFPIDVQKNPPKEVRNYSGIYPLLPTGAWELLVMYKATDRTDVIQATETIISTTSLGSGITGSTPLVTTKAGIGATGWLGRGSYWKLRAADGTPVPENIGGLAHRLKKGESWVYRDSTSSSSPYAVYPLRNHKICAYVSLELLETPSDSDGWTRLVVHESVHPDSGTPFDTTMTILLDTLRRIARVGSHVGNPWSLPSLKELDWAIGLLKHWLLPDSAKSGYAEAFSSFEGEVNGSGRSRSYSVNLDSSIGATSIASSSSSRGIMFYSYYSYWTLVSHSLDNIILPASARSSSRLRDITWLRERIAQDPSLEVTRFSLDGSCLRGRGSEALNLLNLRGMGILRFRDGQEMVDLRVFRP